MRPVPNGSRDERPFVHLWREIDDLKRTTKGIPSRWPNFPRQPSAAAITREVTQAAHGFFVGQLVGTDVAGTTWYLTTGGFRNDIAGVVIAASTNTFTVCLEGLADVNGQLYINGQPSGTGTAAENTLYYSSSTAGSATVNRDGLPNGSLVRANYMGMDGGRIMVFQVGLNESHTHRLWETAGVYLNDPAVSAPDDGDVLTFDASLGLYGMWKASPAGAVADDSITDAKLRESAALSVIGRSANSVGNPADIVAAGNGRFLRRKSDALAFGGIEADDLAGSPSAGYLLVATSATATGWQSVATAVTPAAIGAVDSTTFAGHSHTLTGDVSGNLSASVVDKIAGIPVPTSPADKTFLRYDDSTSSWVAYELPTTVRGDLLTVNSSGALQRREVGLAGQFLRSDGLDPSWATLGIDELLALSAGRYALDRAGTLRTTTGTHTFNASSKYFLAVLVGSGGGGESGSAGNGSGTFAGQGGGSGELVIVFGKITATSASITIGTAGAVATNGGDVTFVMNGETVTAGGGKAGGAVGGGAGGAAGYTAAAQSANFIAHRRPGDRGESGQCRTVNFSGAGAVSSITCVGGYGGSPQLNVGGTFYGGGGYGGGNNSVAAGAGTAGAVLILEA